MRYPTICASGLAALPLLALNSPPVLAASLSQQQYEAAGGIVSKDQDTVQRVVAIEEHAGNSPNSHTVNTEATMTGQGNADDKAETASDCADAGSSTSSARCR